jgi:hypothetical protein
MSLQEMYTFECIIHALRLEQFQTDFLCHLKNCLTCHSLSRKLLREFTTTRRVFSLIDNIKTNSKLEISLFTIVLACPQLSLK